MAKTASIYNSSSIHIQWMWQSDRNLFLESQPTEWNNYSDVENSIIEDAFKAKKRHATLDDYYIDFERNLQIDNNDLSKQRLVKREVCNRNVIRIREERFTCNPIVPKYTFGDDHKRISSFIREVSRNLGIEEKGLLSYDKTIVSTIVERAALGIIEEGKSIGKKCEADWMAQKLMQGKNSGMHEVWKCCATLYTQESFLYKKVNEVMRSTGSDQSEPTWRSKLHTFGPFCLLFWNYAISDKPTEKVKTLYRGVTLSSAEISSFQDDCSRNPKPERSFQAFTSCSRNRAVAEIYGTNALLIIYVQYVSTVDLAPFSEYPYEEEELLCHELCFILERVEYDKIKNKYLVYLKLKQTPHSKSIFSS